MIQGFFLRFVRALLRVFFSESQVKNHKVNLLKSGERSTHWKTETPKPGNRTDRQQSTVETTNWLSRQEGNGLAQNAEGALLKYTPQNTGETHPGNCKGRKTRTSNKAWRKHNETIKIKQEMTQNTRETEQNSTFKLVPKTLTCL